MSSPLVIVAIPSEDDYVWKLSSEKVPHMTLLLLGDAENPDISVLKIAEFMEHAAQPIPRFGMSVDRRGELGPDQADVLFFDMTPWNDWIIDFRSQLLKDNNIFKAYNSTPQRDGFIPHLTMGYPDSPAKEDTRDYPGISWVNFDKLALWFGDYQGVEVNLKGYDHDLAVGWSEIHDLGSSAVDEILHYGVKGMHWGVRKSGPTRHSVDSAKASKARRKLKEKGIHSLSNDEIRVLTQRIDLEKRIKDTSTTSAKIKKGHGAVKALLAAGATVNAAIMFANSPAGKAVTGGLKLK